MGRESIRQQFTTLDSFLNVLQHGLEERVLLPLAQQFERLENRQSCLNQGQELLVEDHKHAQFQALSAPSQQACRRETRPVFDGIDQVSLLEEAVADVLSRD